MKSPASKTVGSFLSWAALPALTFFATLSMAAGGQDHDAKSSSEGWVIRKTSITRRVGDKVFVETKTERIPKAQADAEAKAEAMQLRSGEASANGSTSESPPIRPEESNRPAPSSHPKKFHLFGHDRKEEKIATPTIVESEEGPPVTVDHERRAPVEKKEEIVHTETPVVKEEETHVHHTTSVAREPDRNEIEKKDHASRSESPPVKKEEKHVRHIASDEREHEHRASAEAASQKKKADSEVESESRVTHHRESAPPSKIAAEESPQPKLTHETAATTDTNTTTKAEAEKVTVAPKEPAPPVSGPSPTLVQDAVTPVPPMTSSTHVMQVENPNSSGDLGRRSLAAKQAVAAAENLPPVPEPRLYRLCGR